MKEKSIKKEAAKLLLDAKFIRVFDLQYEEGKHYYDATRRNAENLAATKTNDEFRSMQPDAVSCVVVLDVLGKEPRLLLSHEYRYPAGRFLLSIPAGLIDPEDSDDNVPALTAAKREIEEETGLTVQDGDELFLLSPLLFSTPGMTDESNALACAVLHSADENKLTQAGAVGSECFDGFELVTAEQAKQILRSGRDRSGYFYSIYTWAALMSFVHEEWRMS